MDESESENSPVPMHGVKRPAPDSPLDSPLDPLSSPQPMQSKLPEDIEPFTFEWDDNDDVNNYDSDNDSSDADTSQYECDFDDLNDDKDEQRGTSSHSGSYQPGLEQYEEWYQGEGWAPMSDDQQQYERDRDYLEQRPRLRSRSRSRDSFEAPGLRREYHEFINGKIFRFLLIHQTYRYLISYTLQLKGRIYPSRLPPASIPKWYRHEPRPSRLDTIRQPAPI